MGGHVHVYDVAGFVAEANVVAVHYPSTSVQSWMISSIWWRRPPRAFTLSGLICGPRLPTNMPALVRSLLM